MSDPTVQAPPRSSSLLVANYLPLRPRTPTGFGKNTNLKISPPPPKHFIPPVPAIPSPSLRPSPSTSLKDRYVLPPLPVTPKSSTRPSPSPSVKDRPFLPPELNGGPSPSLNTDRDKGVQMPEPPP